jgi:hypothetical protein
MANNDVREAYLKKCAEITQLEKLSDQLWDEAENNRHNSQYVSLRAKAKNASDRHRAAQQEAAGLFGQSRGWKLSKSDFGWRTLARRMSGSDRGEESYRYTSLFVPPGCDHTWFYRDEFRRACAIATHPYRSRKEYLREYEDFAMRFGLSLEMPNLPSWYAPGETVFMLWTAPEIGLSKDDLLRREASWAKAA